MQIDFPSAVKPFNQNSFRSLCSSYIKPVQYFSFKLLRLYWNVQIASSDGILYENAIYCIQIWKRLINPFPNFQAYLEMPAEMSSAEIALREIASFFHTPSSLISFAVIFYLHFYFYWKFCVTQILSVDQTTELKFMVSRPF